MRRVKKALAVSYGVGFRRGNQCSDENCSCHAGFDNGSGEDAGFRLSVRLVKTSTRLWSIVSTRGAPIARPKRFRRFKRPLATAEDRDQRGHQNRPQPESSAQNVAALSIKRSVVARVS